jgi:hypothetical protein
MLTIKIISKNQSEKISKTCILVIKALVELEISKSWFLKQFVLLQRSQVHELGIAGKENLRTTQESVTSYSGQDEGCKIMCLFERPPNDNKVLLG